MLATTLSLVFWVMWMPLGAWYTSRNPVVHNDTWGGAFCFFLGPLGFVPSWLLIRYMTRRQLRQMTTAA